MRKLSLLFCSLMLLALAACTPSDKNAIPEASKDGGGSVDAAPPATASITGKITFEAKFPRR
jgi:hypothetical protein